MNISEYLELSTNLALLLHVGIVIFLLLRDEQRICVHEMLQIQLTFLNSVSILKSFDCSLEVPRFIFFLNIIVIKIRTFDHGSPLPSYVGQFIV